MGLRQLALLVSHAGHTAPTSPLSSAVFISAKPLYPDTNWTGNPKATWRIFGKSYKSLPSPVAPNLIRVFEAIHLLMSVIPVLLLVTHMDVIPTGAPIHSN